MSANRKTASRRSLRNPTDLFGSGGCDSSSVLPLPAPAEQTQRAEAGGEEWERGGQWGFVSGIVETEAFTATQWTIADGEICWKLSIQYRSRYAYLPSHHPPNCVANFRGVACLP